FVNTFDMQGRDVYIAGESYAGMYIPYIADAMFAAQNQTYFNLQSTMMLDPLLNNNNVMRQVPTPSFVNEWNNLLGLNESFISNLQLRDEACGYTRFLENNLRYPPAGKL